MSRTQPAALRALVVDDEETNRAVLLGMLSRLGIAARAAASGASALAAIEDDAFSHVLLDCRMPHMDGCETARLLRENEARTGQPRKRLIGVLAEPNDGPRMLAAGCDDVIVKPVRVSALTRVLVLPQESAAARNTTTDATTAVENLAARLRARLAVLASGMGAPPGRAAELLGVFRTSIETHSARVDAAARSGDWEQARNAAHALIGASSYLDAHELEASCRRLHALPAGDDAAITREAKALLAEAARVLAAVNTMTVATHD